MTLTIQKTPLRNVFFSGREEILASKEIYQFLKLLEHRTLQIVSKRCYFAGTRFRTQREYQKAEHLFFIIIFRKNFRNCFVHFEKRTDRNLIRCREVDIKRKWNYSPGHYGFIDWVIPVILSLPGGIILGEMYEKKGGYSLSCFLIALIALEIGELRITFNLDFLNENNCLKLVAPFMSLLMGLWNQIDPLCTPLLNNSTAESAFFGFFIVTSLGCYHTIKFDSLKKRNVFRIVFHLAALHQTPLAIVNSLFLSHVFGKVPWSRMQHLLLKKVVALCLTSSIHLPLLLKHTIRKMRKTSLLVFATELCGTTALLKSGGMPPVPAIAIGATAMALLRAAGTTLSRVTVQTGKRGWRAASLIAKVATSHFQNFVNNLLPQVSAGYDFV